MAVDEIFFIELDAILGVLDQLDYYQLLKVSRDASFAEIQAAFFRESRQFHPDRYFGVADDDLKVKLNTLYKRLSEGYGVLKDPDARHLYEQQLNRGGPLRFERAALDALNRQAVAPEMAATTQQGRKFMVLGLESLKRGDARGASLNFQFALNAEPTNDVIKSFLQQAKDKMARP